MTDTHKHIHKQKKHAYRHILMQAHATFTKRERERGIERDQEDFLIHPDVRIVDVVFLSS